MEKLVRVGGWEHLCCGKAVEIGDTVEWDVVQIDDGAPVETHHEPEPGSQRVAGRIAEIRAVFDDGEKVSVRRVPGGRALCGFDDLDDGHLVDAVSGRTLPSRATSFHVVLAV